MAYTDREDLNYLGVFYLIGQNQTPFLNAIGGLNQGRRVRSFQFPVNQNSSIAAASQDTQSEATAQAAGTPTTVTRAQVYNVIQIMKKDVEVTYAKQSASGEFSGLNVDDPNTIASEFDFQRTMQLRQMAKDVDYSFIRGSFVDSSLASTNTKTRGIEEAVSTNVVAAGSTDLDKDVINEVLRTMLAAGSPMNNLVFLVNAFQKQQLSDIYGFAPMDRNVGGVAINTVITDFATIGVMYDPNVTTSVVNILDMSYIQPVFLPFENRNGTGRILDFEEVDADAASRKGFWYTQIGLDYGHEIFHGKITGLTTE